MWRFAINVDMRLAIESMGSEANANISLHRMTDHWDEYDDCRFKQYLLISARVAKMYSQNESSLYLHSA